MRLWSLHPSYLDRRGLVACWREALLAKAVLSGTTRGYRHHPQLERFREHPRPVLAINTYLRHLHAEATQRGYKFQRVKCGRRFSRRAITVTTGQLRYEWRHLRRKVRGRDRAWLTQLRSPLSIMPNPLFRVRPGPIEPWEKIP